MTDDSRRVPTMVPAQFPHSDSLGGRRAILDFDL